MYCSILSTLYIRSNGDIPCYDDVGRNLVLGRAAAKRGAIDIDGVLEGPMYHHIRASFARSELPWPDLCSLCPMLRRHEPFRDDLRDRRIITLQVEPTLACALSCPGCSRTEDINLRPGLLAMPPDLFARIMAGLRDAGYTIDQIEYCGNGEPLNHPRFGDFVLAARQAYPDTHQTLVTNGNQSYAEKLSGVALDHVIVSCDGATAASYGRYRIGGDFDQVARFLRDVPRRVGDRRQLLTWKYILFDFNDSDDELRLANGMAEAWGVDALRLVVTHSLQASERFTPSNVVAATRLGARITVDATPVHARESRSLVRAEGLFPAETGHAAMMIDDLAQGDDGLEVRGWALSLDPIDLIDVHVNGVALGQARHGEPRLDVAQRYGWATDVNSGFRFRFAREAVPGSSYDVRVSLKVGSETVLQQSSLFIPPESDLDQPSTPS